MTYPKIHKLICAAGTGLIAFTGMASTVPPDENHFPSGLLRSFTATAPAVNRGNDQEAAFAAFLKEKFQDGQGGITWRKHGDIVDKTHVHRLYELTYRGRRVLNQFVKLHYRHTGKLAGTVEYATSSWSTKFLTSGIYSQPALALHVLQSQVNARFGSALPAVDQEEALLLEPGTQRLRPVLIVQSKEKHPAALTRFIVDGNDGRIISERNTIRHLQDTHHDHSHAMNDAPVPSRVDDFGGTNNCYAVSPPLSDPPTMSVDSCSLLDLDSTADGSVLAGPYFQVRRGRSGGDPVDVVFKSSGTSQNYTGGAFDQNDPDNYANPFGPGGVVCNTAGTTDCVNQSFDAVNVYAHLSSFRRKMITYLNVELGVTQCGTGTCFPADPMKVIVNAQPVSVGSGTISSNNAAYIPKCSIFNYDSCLVFFKPAPILGSECGLTGTINLYNVARETSVIVHEFQHYITDSITNIAFATSSQRNVGDALHEGYSDYFAASHVMDPAINPSPPSHGTKILGYAFRECPVIIRDVAVLRPFKIEENGAPEYDVGTTWASGLYQLRSELPSIKDGDLLVLKSQFFINPNPGYIDAIESLVKADQVLNEGVNVSRIRTLFYDELKFVNGGASPFRNTETLVAEVGFRSCTSVGQPNATGNLPSAALSLGAMLTWLLGTLGAGRFTKGRS